MTLIKTEPKKIYIWVDEPGYTYDFRNKSTAIVQADWWQTTGTSTVYRWANWFDSNSDTFFFWLPVSEPNATRVRITWHFWIYGTVWSWSGAGKLGVNSNPNFTSDNWCWVYFWMLTSSSHRMRWFGWGSSSTASSTLWATSWESYEIVLELNKTTNTRHCTIAKAATPSTYIIDISTTLVSVNWNYIVVSAWVNGSPTGTFKDIKIEYDY